MLKKSDFRFEVPQELIAQFPSSSRTESRLLVLDDDRNIDSSFERITDCLTSDDLLVVNDTRVIKARFHAIKDTGGRAEVLVDRVVDDDMALCKVGASKPLKPHRLLNVKDHQIRVLERRGEFYLLQFNISVESFLQKYGKVPLPPYVARSPKPQDEDRYQTVYAKKSGAVAAPTAGLHFDVPLMSRIEDLGVTIAKVTLHVGAGTFNPIRTDQIEEHEMHAERFSIPDHTLSLLEERNRRIVAVGTTVVRTLESWAQTGQTNGETDLFIQPGHDFRVVDALITNFHLPESSLLVLVSAFIGRERVLNAYRHAVQQRYRFFSYGDAMFCRRQSD